MCKVLVLSEASERLREKEKCRQAVAGRKRKGR